MDRLFAYRSRRLMATPGLRRPTGGAPMFLSSGLAWDLVDVAEVRGRSVEPAQSVAVDGKDVVVAVVSDADGGPSGLVAVGPGSPVAGPLTVGSLFLPGDAVVDVEGVLAFGSPRTAASPLFIGGLSGG